MQGGADSFLTLAEMAAAGLGQAILPCIVGDSDPRLERRRHRFPPTAVEIWVASHVELHELPRLQAARTLLGKALAQQAEALLGG
jgi:DNA-binding transcriptional LysR family regulator